MTYASTHASYSSRVTPVHSESRENAAVGDCIGPALAANEILPGFLAFGSALDHGQLFRHVDGNGVFLGRTTFFGNSRKRHIVLIFNEIVLIDTVIDPS